MKSIFYQLITCILVVLAIPSKAQTYSIHQNSGYDPLIREMYRPGVNLHSSVKPYRLDEVNKYYSTDSLIQKGLYKPTERVYLLSRKQPADKLNIFQRFIHDDLFSWDDKDDNIFVRINPLANFEIGKEFSEVKNTWVNTRGVMIEGRLGKNISFYGDFYENQAVFPQYLHNHIGGRQIDRDAPVGQYDERYVVPGQGRVKPYNDGGFDYSQSNGYVSYNAGEWINFQVCYGKNFIGDGYRSLLLSDNASPYGHFKITTTFWKLKYLWMVAKFDHFDFYNRGIMGVSRFPTKYGVFHYLTGNIGERFSFGIYESVMCSAKDEEGHRGLDMNYLNPFLFYRPVELAVGSPDNMLVGANAKLIVWKDAAIYGQFILNEFKLDELRSGNKWWANKYGYQIGVKSYNFLGINNLDVQTEYNHVRPFTYSHYGRTDKPRTNEKQVYTMNYFGHANQELMHPLGANFRESVSILRYRYGRWHIELKNMMAIHGKDKKFRETKELGANNFATWYISYGGDIFKSNEDRFGSHGHEVGQGIKTDILNVSGELSWLVNPKTNMNIAIGGLYRKQSNEKGENFDKFENVNKLFFVTIRTSLRNFYYDF